jgi:hypothetical protein
MHDDAVQCDCRHRQLLSRGIFMTAVDAKTHNSSRQQPLLDIANAHRIKLRARIPLRKWRCAATHTVDARRVPPEC